MQVTNKCKNALLYYWVKITNQHEYNNMLSTETNEASLQM